MSSECMTVIFIFKENNKKFTFIYNYNFRTSSSVELATWNAHKINKFFVFKTISEHIEKLLVPRIIIINIRIIYFIFLISIISVCKQIVIDFLIIHGWLPLMHLNI